MTVPHPAIHSAISTPTEVVPEPDRTPDTALGRPGERPARALGTFREATGVYRAVWAGYIWRALSIAVLFVDVLAAKNAFDLALNSTEFLSWVIAVGATLAAAVAAMEGGGALRRALDPVAGGSGHVRVARVAAGALLGAWIVVGATMFWLRLTISARTGDPQATPAAELPIALLIAGFYLAAGFSLITQSFVEANPKLIKFARADRAYRRVFSMLAVDRARLVGVNHQLTSWQALVLQPLIDAEQVQLGRIEAARALAADRARAALATRLGDPGSTTSVLQSAHVVRSVPSKQPDTASQ